MLFACGTISETISPNKGYITRSLLLTFPGIPKIQKQRRPETHRSFPIGICGFQTLSKVAVFTMIKFLSCIAVMTSSFGINIHSKLMENNPVPSTVMIPITVEYEDLFLVIPLLQLGFKLDLLGLCHIYN